MEEISKNKKDFIFSIKLLKSYLKNFEDGDKLFYLPMAVELRKLFCDKNPLIISIIPDFKLKKLHVTEMIEEGFITSSKLVNMVPGCLEFENGEVKKFTLTLSLNLTPV